MKMKITCDAWYVTHDMQQCDTCKLWHMTCYTLWGGEYSFKISATSLWFMIVWRFGEKGWLTKTMNYKGFCRTAPVTPDLLVI